MNPSDPASCPMRPNILTVDDSKALRVLVERR